MPEYNGVFNIYKEAGWTSFDVVAKMRGILHMKKIGHTGTLDPQATGVLPVCAGKATKFVERIQNHDKVYEAVLLLGTVTDTQDMTGEIVKQSPANADEAQIKEVIKSFTGEIMQLPPMYSALKVNGKKLVDLARKGVEVERQPRPVTIHEIKIEGIDLPRVKMTVRCSKGTYIRTLCNDIGEKLGCGGCMESLIRTETGGFKIEDAITIAQLQEYADREIAQNYMVDLEKLNEMY